MRVWNHAQRKWAKKWGNVYRLLRLCGVADRDIKIIINLCKFQCIVKNKTVHNSKFECHIQNKNIIKTFDSIWQEKISKVIMNICRHYLLEKWPWHWIKIWNQCEILLTMLINYFIFYALVLSPSFIIFVLSAPFYTFWKRTSQWILLENIYEDFFKEPLWYHINN